MSQVIEETIRGGTGPRPSELEGLACPRTKSPQPSGGGPPPGAIPQGPPGMPPSSKHGHPGGGFRHNGGGTGNGDPDYGAPTTLPQMNMPQMEGLSARFNSHMFKRVESNDNIMQAGPGGPPNGPPGGRMMAHQNKPGGPMLGGPGGPNAPPWESQQQHPGSAYGYRSAHFQQQGPPPPGSHPGPPGPPMGSVAVSVASFGNSTAAPPRKRASPSSSTMPVLPPKKQHTDSGVDYSFHKGNYHYISMFISPTTSYIIFYATLFFCIDFYLSIYFTHSSSIKYITLINLTQNSIMLKF